MNIISFEAEKATKYLEQALRSFEADPPDSGYQRGYLAALLTIYTEALGKGVGDDRITLLGRSIQAPIPKPPQESE